MKSNKEYSPQLGDLVTVNAKTFPRLEGKVGVVVKIKNDGYILLCFDGKVYRVSLHKDELTEHEEEQFMPPSSDAYPNC
tara:strand:- start:310 stop:546 length:237 start_codon:yes stop_codon:yes gene_type:complete